MWPGAAEFPCRHVQVDGGVSALAAADRQRAGAESARRVCRHGGPGMRPNASGGALARLPASAGVNKILS